MYEIMFNEIQYKLTHGKYFASITHECALVLEKYLTKKRTIKKSNLWPQKMKIKMHNGTLS